MSAEGFAQRFGAYAADAPPRNNGSGYVDPAEDGPKYLPDSPWASRSEEDDDG